MSICLCELNILQLTLHTEVHIALMDWRNLSSRPSKVLFLAHGFVARNVCYRSVAPGSLDKTKGVIAGPFAATARGKAVS